MGRKPITINEPNPITSENNEIKFDDVEDQHVVEFDDIDEKIVEQKEEPKKSHVDLSEIIDNEDVKKIVLIYADKTFEVISRR